ncbi:MAG TPA: hypothetical protein PLQ15_07310 [Syntrophales bacterium]|nr:hypothetical protein [Syntrophobacterales bacterium]HQL90394.1 hypothetical protein [Syntrophales bacterium]
MLINAHTWLLKEYAGARLGLDNLDILLYNVMPDILPIHREITPEMTHRMERLGGLPPGRERVRFIQFHLLVDDLSHHGRITHHGHDRSENESGGYAFLKGAALAGDMMGMHRRLGSPIDGDEALYRSHLIIEMAVDLVIHRRNPGVMDLFSRAVEATLEDRIDGLIDTLSWAYAMSGRLARDAVLQGLAAYRREILRRSVSLEGRVDLFLWKFFGGDAGDSVRQGVRDLLERGIESVADHERFLSATLRAIAASGFDGGL